MLRTNSILAILASACTILCASLPGAARATNYTWTLSGGTGNWFTAGNWNPFGPPTSSYNAYVANGGTAVIAQSGAACSTLIIGGTNAGWVQINGGALSDGYLELGSLNNGAAGAGAMNLSSGVLSTTYTEYIGLSGIGNFTQSDGRNSVSTLYVGNGSGSYGTYNMQGGALAVNQEAIGLTGTGTFTQSGGTHTVIGSLVLANNLFSEGNYNLDGGTLTCSQVSGGAGNSYLNLDGGQLVAAPNATKSLNSNFISGLSALTVGNSAAASYTQSSGSNNVGVLYLGFNASATGAYNLNGSGVFNAASEFIGTSGSGSFTQSGGTNMSSAFVVGMEVGATGSYNLNGSGVLICISNNPAYESIGYQGNGSFTQSAGMNNTNILYIGAGLVSNGTYSLNGGTLTCQQIQGGAGTSTLNLDGGVLLPAASASSNFINGLSTLTVGNYATASYAQSSGNVTVGNLYLGFNPSASGSYNLNGSGVLNATGEFIGYSGSGSFTQSGGMNNTNILTIGAGSVANGTYSLNGGTLTCQQIQGGLGASTLVLDGGVLLPAASASSNFISGLGTLTVGNNATASYSQSSGYNSVSNLYLGFNPSASGSYNLNGSGALNATSEFIGYSGSGSFTQSAGMNSTVLLKLGRMAGGNGTYNLNGGLLSCGQILGGAGMSTFNFNGGVLQAAPSASSNFISGLTAAYVKYGGGTIDTNGQLVTIDQKLLDGGGGGLTVTGGGVLILANSNTYVGGTTLYGALLVASNGTQGSATGNGPVTAYSAVLAAGPAGGTITGPVILGVGAAASGIEPGAFNPGSSTLNLLGGLIVENGSELYYTLKLSSSITTGRNGLPVYGGDLINLGGSNLFVVSGSVGFASNPILPGDYRLIANVSNSNSVNFAELAPPTVRGETFAWSTTADPGYIDLVTSGVLGASGGTWVSPVSGSWGTAANWITNLPGGFPVGGTVWFPGAPSAPINVALNGSQTAGALVFNVANSNGYTLAQGSGGALTLGTVAGASIAVLGGSNTISAPIQMAGNLTLSVTSGASLQMAGLLTETATGTSVTFNGPGPTFFSGTATYTGNTNVYGGTLQITSSAQLLSSFNWQIGGATGAIVVQQGGSNSLTNQLCVGLSPTMTGSYTLQAGTLNTNETDIGFNGPGVFTQIGGVHSTQLLEFGSSGAINCSGTYNLIGGTLTCQQIQGIAGASTLNLDGGLLLPAASASSNFISGVGTLTVGNSATASYAQSSGSNNVGNLYLGFNASASGSYNLNGSAVLNATGEFIGYSGSGSFAQSGGMNNANVLCIGASLGGSGTYNLSAGNLSANQESIPLGGIGIFNQTGGTNTVSMGMSLGGGSGGSYNLNDGLLTTSSLSMGAGTGGATFNASGGTFQAGASFTTSLPMTLTGANGPAVFDGNGYSLILAGVLSGSGGLTAGFPFESNGGTLTLAAQNAYRGATILNAGMMVVANGSLGSATGTNSVTLNGGTLAAGPVGTITGTVYGGSGSHMIAPGAGLPAGQFGTLRLTGGLTTNANTTLLFNLGTPVAGGTYSGDLIDLGASALTVGGGTIAFVVNPVTSGDYRLFANLSNSPSLANFTLPSQSGQYYTLSTAIDPGFVDLVDTTSNGYNWAAASGDWTGQANWNPSGWPTSMDNCYVQNGGTAGVSQGSDAAACGTLYVGTASGSGAVAMSTGVLASATEYIGYSGTGTFNQSGGNHAVSSAMFVGYAPGSNGTYSLSGSGQLRTIFDEYLGWSGTGVFNQTGGTNTVGNPATERAVILATQLGSTGIYNLNGGLLQLYGLSQGGGNAMFNAGGGTFRAMDSFASSVPMTLTEVYGPAVFDTNGNTLTLIGSISGSGGLEKIGAGTLVLSGSNGYSGGTTVEHGTLIVANNDAIEDGTNLSVGADLSVFGTLVPTGHTLAGPDQATGVPAAAPVPEPGTLALLAVSSILLLQHLRRRAG
jgi:autotransporter-associated beta strand protein